MKRKTDRPIDSVPIELRPRISDQLYVKKRSNVLLIGTLFVSLVTYCLISLLVHGHITLPWTNL